MTSDRLSASSGFHLRRLLQEPLLQFLILGALLFGWFEFQSRDGAAAPGEIVVSQGRVDSLITGFSRTWQRPPTAEELQGLIRDFVREEACYREALAMGLDQDDTLVRRRMRQKLEFVAQDLAELAEPSEADLEAFLAAHPGDFRDETRYTFAHIYLSPDRRGERVAQDAADLLAKLQGGSVPDPAALGDPILLEPDYTAAPASDVAALFGQAFADALPGCAPGAWLGPVTSGFGLHLVRVSARTEASLPALPDVRDAVRRAWTTARYAEAMEAFYAELLTRYTVMIEAPEPSPGSNPVGKVE